MAVDRIRRRRDAVGYLLGLFLSAVAGLLVVLAELDAQSGRILDDNGLALAVHAALHRRSGTTRRPGTP